MRSVRSVMGAIATVYSGVVRRIFGRQWRPPRNRASQNRKDPRSLPVTGNRQDTLLLAARFRTRLSGRLLAIFSPIVQSLGLDVGAHSERRRLSVDEPRKLYARGITARPERSWVSDEAGNNVNANPSFSQAETAAKLLGSGFHGNERHALGGRVRAIQNAHAGQTMAICRR